MKIEDLKVGNEYINSTGGRVKLLYIGKEKVFAKEVSNGHEYLSFREVIESWEEIPKEPKKLGDLLMCIEDTPDGRYKEDDLTVGIRAHCNRNRFTPVTVNEKGEVFEIL